MRRFWFLLRTLIIIFTFWCSAPALFPGVEFPQQIVVDEYILWRKLVDLGITICNGEKDYLKPIRRAYPKVHSIPQKDAGSPWYAGGWCCLIESVLQWFFLDGPVDVVWMEIGTSFW